jgi:hypothetical protein
MSEINIYCDESCHLENDQSNVMVLGGITCPDADKRKTFERIRDIKQKHKLAKDFEIKWTKVSESKINFYLDLVDYFFDNESLRFRALIVPEKNKLRHRDFSQSHDQFYYKMYYDMLKILLNPAFQYNIYLDVKDTNGAEKIKKLEDLLGLFLKKKYCLNKPIIKRIQEVRSNEVELLQLADLLIGAVSYLNRGAGINKGKLKIIDYIRKKTLHPLDCSTLPAENKFNLFKWTPQEEAQ